MNEELNTVSVVIPAYNYGCYVTEAVECALAQTHRPLEVLVIDDGSTDDTRTRLEPYMDRITYIYKDNAGLSAARNTGIRLAKGEWIALLDADDLWHPRKIEIQLAAVAADPAIGLIGLPEYFGDMPEVVPDNPPVRRIDVHDCLAHPPWAPSTVLIRRRCFDTVGLFDETLTSVEDRDMWLRLLVAYPSLQVHSRSWWYRLHPNQMNRNSQRMFDNYARVLDNFFAAHPEFRQHRRFAIAHMHLDASRAFSGEGRRGAAIQHVLASWWYWPFSLRSRERRNRLLRVRLLTTYLLGRSPMSVLRS
jgi:glycosyltransferase involved in cell wall biosynthesis